MLTMTFLGLTAIFGMATLARARALRARRVQSRDGVTVAFRAEISWPV